jgi:hypothetical protein
MSRSNLLNIPSWTIANEIEWPWISIVRCSTQASIQTRDIDCTCRQILTIHSSKTYDINMSCVVLIDMISVSIPEGQQHVGWFVLLNARQKPLFSQVNATNVNIDVWCHACLSTYVHLIRCTQVASTMYFSLHIHCQTSRMSKFLFLMLHCMCRSLYSHRLVYSEQNIDFRRMSADSNSSN